LIQNYLQSQFQFHLFFSASQAKGGWFTALKGLVGSKTLTKEDVAPGLAKMKDHLITKNVAIDIADKLCQSVSTKLEGRVLGTFSGESSCLCACKCTVYTFTLFLA
jgi:signal recognition particle GTPase